MSAAIRAALRDMLGPDVGIGITDPRAPEQGLLQPELPFIARAIPKRHREFAAGRRAARAAMAELGLPPAPIPVGTQREPLWPEGLVGSIAHCDTTCIAVVSQSHQSLGIDIEEATPLPADLEDTICTPSERAWLDTLPQEARGLAAKRIFSAKEAIYKAQYPLTGQVIGFGKVKLSSSGETARLDVTFDNPASAPHPLPRSCNVSLSGAFILSVCAASPVDFTTGAIMSP